MVDVRGNIKTTTKQTIEYHCPLVYTNPLRFSALSQLSHFHNFIHTNAVLHVRHFRGSTPTSGTSLIELVLSRS